MKLYILCMECLKVSVQPDINMFQLVEVRDNNTYELTCSRGHHTVTVLQQQKFEVLLEIGANAIIDGYYREAVSSFTSSLERFYEFAIRVLLENSTSSEKLGSPEKLFQDCWEDVSLTERQLGAFIFIWAYCFGEKPKLLSKKVRLRSKSLEKFRNNVIHNGIIPTKEEALKYGNAVIEVIRPNIQQLQERFSTEVEKVTSRDIRDSRSKVGEDKPVASTMETLTSIGLTSEQDSNQMTLEEYLSKLVAFRTIIDILKQQPTDS